MRHKIAGNTLNRKTSHRKATVRDIAKSTLIHQRICTTKVKAQESRKLVDQLITLGKKGDLADKRKAFSILCDHKLVSRLFAEIAPRFKDRQGGYTRLIKMGNRRGDNAEMVLLELTEKVEIKKAVELKKSKAKVEKPAEVKDSKESKTVKEPEKFVKEEKAAKKDPSVQKKPSGIRKIFGHKKAS